MRDNPRSGEYLSSAESTLLYAGLSGDFNPLHVDPDFAARTSFGAAIVHGSQTLALVIEHLESTLPDDMRLERSDVRFIAPVAVGTRMILHISPSPDRQGCALRVDDGGETVFLEGTASFAPRRPDHPPRKIGDRA